MNLGKEERGEGGREENESTLRYLNLMVDLNNLGWELGPQRIPCHYISNTHIFSTNGWKIFRAIIF